MSRKKPTGEVVLMDTVAENTTANSKRAAPGAMLNGLNRDARDHACDESQDCEIACSAPGRAAITSMTAVKDRQQLPVTKKKKDELIALIPNLRAFAFSLCGHRERADDLVQETLLKAWSHLDSYQDGTNLRAWLFTILRNTFFSEMRKRRREVEDADGKKAESLSTAPAQQGHVDMHDLCKALGLLPPYQREAIVMIGAAGLSYEEAAKIAKCAVGTIKSRVNRARSRLAQILAVDGAQAFGPDFATGAITENIVSAR